MRIVKNISTGFNNPGADTLNRSIFDFGGTMLYTKLMMPSPSSDCISRIRLISRLEEVINKKLTLISAPAGYGKTTLISMWLSQKGTNIKSIWVSLDKTDNNLYTFWKYMLLAIEKSASGDVEDNESTYCAIMEYSIDILLNGLINKLSGMNDVIVLALDDYHVIYEDTVHRSMQYFIDHLPLNVHVVIISRGNLPLKLARLRSHGDFLELRTEELKLDFSEVSQFLNKKMELCIDENEVRKLEEWTEGWITALNLAALTIKNCSDVRKNLNDYRHINDYMLEYMSEEVFNLLNSDIKDFLLKTSILDTFNCYLCNAVVDINNSQELINILVKKNIFIIALDNKKNNYRYHSIFADFLKSKLKERPPEILEELYLRASLCYEENKMVNEALDYSVRSNNYQHTVSLMEKYGEIMIISRDLMTFAETIESLPKQVIKKNAKICALYTLAVAGKNNSNGNGILVGNEYISLKNEIFDEYKNELLIIRMVLAYANEDYNNALEYGNEVIKSLNNKCIAKCLPYKILTEIYCTAGNSEKAEAYLHLYIKAMENRKYFDDFFIEINYIYMMVHILYGAGKYKKAIKLLTEFEKKLTAEKMPLPTIANSIYLNLGYLYFELGEIELSQSSIKRCIELSSIKMDIFRLISSYILVARINCSMWNFDSMMEFIKKAEDLCDRYNMKFMLINMIIYIVRMLSTAGEFEYADYIIDKYGIKEKEIFDAAYEEVHLALADLYIIKGEVYKAEGILNKLYENVSGTERNYNHVRVIILKSLLSKYVGNEADAFQYMKEALERASQQGYISIFTEFGISVAEIIIALFKNAEEMDFKNKMNVDYASCILSRIKGSEELIYNFDPKNLKSLSRREVEVLNHILSGFSNKEIAANLFVAESTVKKHINNIYRKVGAINRKRELYFYKKYL